MRRLATLALLPLLAAPALPAAADAVTTIAIDAAAGRHAISPLIYGVSFATTAQLADLDLPLNRAGGNSASLYDWHHEARNAGRDWYFESMAIAPDDPAQYGDRFVATTRAGRAMPMLTLPMIGWSARLAPDGGKRASFSIAKYGLQQASDGPGFPDAGNGLHPDGTLLSGNDPADAATPSTPADRRAWLQHLVARFGTAAQGGVPYYLLDNEPSRWHDIHRDVHPIGLHAEELAQLTIDHARLVKSVDPTAKVVAPEEWGWGGYRYSGFDQQIGDARGYGDLPDRRTQTNGMDLLPWLLTRWKAAGHPVDVVSVHFYPQGGEYRERGDDVSPAMQRLRNRSTRLLWDRDYLDTSWIADRVALIPRLHDWVDRYYRPGTPVAITEYSWGADTHMNGATTQADILGIFGRERLGMAARWTAPAFGTPAYLAMKLFRNPDGRNLGFGDVGVATQVPDPDHVSAFASLRRDGALTVMAINKQLDRAAPVTIALSHVAGAGRLTGFRLAAGRLLPLAPGRYRGTRLHTLLPPQSVTMFILMPDAS